jgi:hypothetical protein
MKSLIKKLINTNSAIKIRNILGIRSVPMSINNIDSFASVSDAFCWRTDNGFSTIFKYSDILNLFYETRNSKVELRFYTKENKFIKNLVIENLDYSNELTINPDLLDGLKDYGSFYVYHLTTDNISDENIISNKCYVGYSKNNGLHSFVHGNTLARFININNHKNLEQTDIIKITFLKNQKYKIQNFFRDLDKSELFFVNPTSKKIRFSIDNMNYYLFGGCSIVIESTKKGSVEIKSNCLFFRPVIFNYKGEYIDAYHG